MAPREPIGEREVEDYEQERSTTNHGRGELSAALACFCISIFFFFMTLTKDPWDDESQEKNTEDLRIYRSFMIVGGVAMGGCIVSFIVGLVIRISYLKKKKLNSSDIPMSDLNPSGECTGHRSDGDSYQNSSLPLAEPTSGYLLATPRDISLTTPSPTAPPDSGARYTPPPSYDEAMSFIQAPTQPNHSDSTTKAEKN